jgi:hypothetical protein
MNLKYTGPPRRALIIRKARYENHHTPSKITNNPEHELKPLQTKDNV